MPRKLTIALALSAAVAMVLSACGASGNQTSGDGVLKYGYPMAVAGIHLDPAKSMGDQDMVFYKLFYGALLRQSADGKYTPWMAENVEVVDPTTVRISLREGVTFSDGADFDAEAVKTSLTHMMNPQTPQAQANLDAGLRAVETVQVVDPLTVTVGLSEPLAGEFYSELARRPGSIVSPKQLAENPDQIDTLPVGAGPFVVTDHQAGQVVSVRKNPTYWDADSVQVNGVDVINTPTGPQQANGLLAAKLDWASYISADSASSIDSDKFKSQVTNVSNIYLNMCTGKAPFDNELFRRAVQIGIDREAFSERVYKGLAEPAYSLLPAGDSSFDPALKDTVTYDPNLAKQLLDQSGVSNSTVDLVFPASINFGQESEVLQAQLEAIGMKVEITPERDANANFMVPQKPGALMYFYVGDPGYRQFTTYFGEGSSQALCGVDRPDVMAAVSVAASVAPDDPRAAEAYREASSLVAEHAYLIPIVSYPNVQGWNSKLIKGEPTFDTLGYVNFDTLDIAG